MYLVKVHLEFSKCNILIHCPQVNGLVAQSLTQVNSASSSQMESQMRDIRGRLSLYKRNPHLEISLSTSCSSFVHQWSANFD